MQSSSFCRVKSGKNKKRDFQKKQKNKAENKSTEEPKARFFERIGYNAENIKKEERRKKEKLVCVTFQS